jgi:hypothetical protein
VAAPGPAPGRARACRSALARDVLAATPALAALDGVTVAIPASDPNEIAKQAREHAWNWFALHATQRMQAFNFFFVATAFLIAAYGSLLEKHPGVAGALAVLGAWLAFLFNRLDVRNRQLVEAGERALKISQGHLASLAQNPNLKLVDVVERTTFSGPFYRRLIEWFQCPSYARVMNAMQWTIVAVFLSAAAYAAGRTSMNGVTPGSPPTINPSSSAR